MLQLILHGIGDYFFQTDKQALGKKLKGDYGLMCCLQHCTTYSLPFFLIGTWFQVLVIFVTHFIVDRTNIIAYAIAFKNGTKEYWIHDSQGYLIKTTKTEATVTKYDISNFGFHPDRPFAITIWLYIICDNLTHIICNYLALKYL